MRAAESLELFDEEGEAVGVYRPTGMRFRVPGDARRPDGEDAAEAPDVVDAPPPVVDPAWWRRHQDLLRRGRQRGGLVFEAGAPGPEPAGDGPDRRRAAAEGPGLDDLIGQERVRGSLRVAVAASRAGGAPLGHTLLAGPPGLGKTTLARALARDAGAGLHQVLASTIRDPELLVRHLCALEPGDVLFLDEVHGLPPPVAEVLYDPLEEGELNLPLAGAGWQQRALRLELPPFTLVGATTEPDALPAPLLSRFVYQEQLDFQEPTALAELVARTAARQGHEPSRQAAEVLAAAARGTPRVALGLLRAARDQALAEGADRLDAAVARRALERAGVEPSGITRAERRYLDLLGAAAGCLGLRVRQSTTQSFRLASPPLAALLVGHVALLRCPSSRLASDGDAGAKRLSCFLPRPEHPGGPPRRVGADRAAPDRALPAARRLGRGHAGRGAARPGADLRSAGRGAGHVYGARTGPRRVQARAGRSGELRSRALRSRSRR